MLPSSANRRQPPLSKRSAAVRRLGGMVARLPEGWASGKAAVRGTQRSVTRRLEREPRFGLERAVHQRAPAKKDRTAEGTHDLDLDTERVADAHVVEQPEIVDRGQIATDLGSVVDLGEECPATLGERLQDERRGQAPIAADTRVGRAHQFQERARALADLDDAVEQQKGRGVRQARPRARPSTTATRTAARRADVTTSRPLRAGGVMPSVGGMTPSASARTA